MPPALVDSDNESHDNEDRVLDAKMEDDVKGKPKVEDENEEEDGGGYEEGEDDSELDVYIVEQILEHRSDFEDGQLRYWVKWKGYEKKADRTWEPEKNLEGAQDILEGYWESIGGKPVPGEDEKPSKKRGRRSTGSAKPEKEIATKKPRSGKGGRKSNGATEQDVDPGPMFGYTDVGNETWKPPRPKAGTPGSWDDLVQSVDTVVREHKDDELYCYLIWKEQDSDGRFYRSKAPLRSIYEAAPQRMLKFYEKHLVFSAPNEDDRNGKVPS